MPHSILITDDEQNIRSGLSRAFTLEGYKVFTACDGKEALLLLKNEEIDLLLCDLKMPQMSGEELIEQALKLKEGLQVIVMTAHGTVETAVKAMQLGAYNFLTKPLNLEHLFLLCNRALQEKELKEERASLKNQLALKEQTAVSGFIGQSTVMKRLYKMIEQVAPTNASVLILGESGVGKELVAEAIHRLSKRKDKPFVKVNCSALAESLLESELFGHEKGSFTGATSQRKGRFEMADGGDIFLDEIGELSPAIQVKLLRVLQERCFERVGGEQTITVDIRLIVATHRNLLEEVKKGNFREDLYYRLNVVQINIPPLRERSEDIEELALQFLHQFNLENGKKIEGFTVEALARLLYYSWPGNIRQLRNCVESAVVLSQSNSIEKEQLPSYLVADLISPDFIQLPLTLTVSEAEQRYIEAILKQEGGNKSKAAARLGLNRKTLLRKTGDTTNVK